MKVPPRVPLYSLLIAALVAGFLLLVDRNGIAVAWAIGVVFGFCYRLEKQIEHLNNRIDQLSDGRK